MFQQLSGINIIIFYSAELFKSHPAKGSTLVNSANCLSAVAGALMLNHFGRKTLLAFWSSVMSILIIFMGISVNSGHETAQLYLTILYICSFEFGSGPIIYLYMSEIMNDKGVAMGIFVNNAFTMLVSIVTPTLLLWYGGWTFIGFGVLSIIGTIFVFVFMKETKGLS